MGTTDLTDTKASGDVIAADDINDLRGALVGDFVGRDGSTKAVAAGERLGTPTYPWGNAYVGGLVVNGTQIDFGSFGVSSQSNAILSGKTTSNSIMSDFIRAAGGSAQFTLLATTTNLVLNIDGTSTTFSSDVAVSSLTTAPSTNNTCLVNESGFSDQDATRYAGQDGITLNVDNMGSNISSKVGQYVTLKGASEYMLAYVKSSTELTNIYRGFYFDSSGNPIEAETLANNDTLTLMSTAWVFAENNGTTVDVTYRSPIYDYVEPSSPSTGDYWFDMQNGTWKRYSGSAFVQINRLLVGVAVINTSACVAARSFNFDNTIYGFNPIKLKWVSNTVISTVETDFNLGVYGNVVYNRKIPFFWDIATDLETGQTESSSTIYYAYISEVGEAILSEIAPYNQNGELGGWYHPHESWRCVGYVENDGSSNFNSDYVRDFSGKIYKEEITSSETWFKPLGVYSLYAECIGGGAGGYAAGTPAVGGQAGNYAASLLDIDTSFYYTMTVGSGGSGGNSSISNSGTDGGDSSIDSLVVAKGGRAVTSGGATYTLENWLENIQSNNEDNSVGDHVAIGSLPYYRTTTSGSWVRRGGRGVGGFGGAPDGDGDQPGDGGRGQDTGTPKIGGDGFRGQINLRYKVG